ncbi:hypothetical protein [Tardiphaga sp. 367_B4_N1_1]|uniref:hypothetical protein n=1 Tax=Tardiphaga sp. 367_B4_N1_1 TaxID=3240777 RepID=UPI003F26B1E9
MSACALCGRPIGEHGLSTADICNTFLSEGPNDIVGHKTIDTGEVCPETGFPKMRHEPLKRSEADALRASVDAATAKREAAMPDEQSAIRHMWDGWYRLKDFGWREASYCPKDGTHFQVIEAGSTGIHDCNYQGEWPNGTYWLFDGDVWPSRPILFKLYPEDQAKEDERRKNAGERFRALMAVESAEPTGPLPSHEGAGHE